MREGEFYQNIDPEELEKCLGAYFEQVNVRCDPKRGDVYAIATCASAMGSSWRWRGVLMRLLCVQPGASYSTADVFNGMVKSLRNQGHDIVQYALDSRIAFGSAYLHQIWNHARRQYAGPRTTQRR